MNSHHRSDARRRLESASSSSLKSHSHRHDFVRKQASISDYQSLRDLMPDFHPSRRNGEEMLDLPDFETFNKTFDTSINKKGDHIFAVRSKAKEFKDVVYKNTIDIEAGRIIGEKNYNEKLSHWHLSYAIRVQLELALKTDNKDILSFDLKICYDKNITNAVTQKIAESLLPQGEGQRTFSAGSDEFNALAQTPTAKSKFYLLKDYPEAFPGKKVTSITVIRNRDATIDINYEFGS